MASNLTASLLCCTGRVEAKTADGWRWRGTAFFVSSGTLLTCAHVVPDAAELRVVIYQPDSAGAIVELPVTVQARYPDLAVHADPYPLPDVAILRVSEADARMPEFSVWLEAAGQKPGDHLYSYGFTDEYHRGKALGHPVRFRSADEAQVDESGPVVYKVTGSRVRPGLSGAPVLDMSTGKVVGIIKSSQYNDPEPQAYFVPMSLILRELPDELVQENERLHSDPKVNDAVARRIWGRLIDVAAMQLAGNSVVLDTVADDLGLVVRDLPGDEAQRSRRVARELFTLDLLKLRDQARLLANIVGAERATALFAAIAPCTSYEDDQWIGQEAAEELAAQVEILAADASAAGRVVYLPVSKDLRDLYIRRADRNSKWSRRHLECDVFSHEVNQLNGLPKDLDRQLRLGVIRAYRGRPGLAGLEADELDAEQRQRWDRERSGLMKDLRRDRTIALLPASTTLDEDLVSSLETEYQLLLLAAGEEAPIDSVQDTPYQRIDPGIDSRHAEKAYWEYDRACRELREEASAHDDRW